MASRLGRLYTAPDQGGAFVRRRCDHSSHTKRPTPNHESDKARSMSGFKEPSFADRQKAAQEARQSILNKFRAKPGLDDPAVRQRQAEREAKAADRAKGGVAPRGPQDRKEGPRGRGRGGSRSTTRARKGRGRSPRTGT